MTKIVHSSPYCFVQVPKGATRPIYNKYINQLIYIHNDFPESVDLPPGTYTIVADTETITEEIARTLVELKANLYRDYLNDKVVCVTALAAFESLLSSLGFSQSDRVIVLGEGKG